ncbi:hypothetical protein N0V93_009180 [Gnomoniopsis smithogilvyi]|uniref:Annexin ANXC4 n=1 Tax=Gnomoniopsis smithogilvyi TaxID=1191159 RepID=A0A9W8YMN6_9PEZI|nr:hypothetical protein N0V93_009180 [Gnomoniopsis smithogilvyi]
MSLQVEGGHHGRSRSRSRSGRERDRSRSRGPPLIVDVNPAYDDRDRNYDYDDRRTSYKSPPSPRDDYYQRPRSPAVDGARTSYGELRDHRLDSPRERHSDSDREREKEKLGLNLAGAFLPQKYAQKLEASDAYNFMTAPISERSRERSHDRRAEKKEKLQEDLAYGKLPAPSSKDMRPVSPRPLSPTSPSYEYGSMSQFRHAQPEKREGRDRRDSYLDPKRSSDLLEVGDRSGRGRSRSKSPGRREHSRDDRDRKRDHSRDHRDKKRDHSRDDRDRKSLHRESLDPRVSANTIVGLESGPAPLKSALKRSSSPQPPVNKMNSLSVNTDAHHTGSLATAPGSPLLESYHGTYQSMSPMPSPLLLPTYRSSEAHILDASPLNSDDELNDGKKRNRRARFTDPEDDAQRLADALKGRGAPQTEPLIEILPGLTHEQVMELRAEYKRLVKTGPEKKGVNVAKHIRVRLKDEDASLMKACYATALGQWESEAYWSSFWYQGDKTRRELLIESLMGRTNEEIRLIKESFSDKTYDNSITRMMKHELKEDKFKKAVLMVLDEERMEDVDAYGRELPIDAALVEDDVHDLRRAVKAEKGGESAMISIVVQRSDNHLREILRVYNEQYRSNFARDALRKSQSLVGELLAHILNGVINKPTRDALLIHHALTASKKDGLRRELLTSRLVRYHWDGKHMAEVKRAYSERYGKDMQEAVKDGTSGEWGQFCSELCITRMPTRIQRFQVTR